jgi:CDP-diacylglycerol--serine O-phosphatidyltransferase
MAVEQTGSSKGQKRPRKRKRRSSRDAGRSNRRFKRGIYLLPGFFTVSNLFMGFMSIISTMHCLAWPSGDGPGPWSLSLSAVFIGIAALLDALDGRVARLANATSQFGVEFDSLADIVSFGMAPSLLIYVWGLQSLGRVGWLTAFIILVCCSARLARFNIRVDSGSTDPRFFMGMPTPAAACFFAALVFAFPRPVTDLRVAIAIMVVSVAISYLMVSNFKYASFKKLGMKNRRPYIFVVLVGLVLVAVAAAPQVVLLSLSLIYLFSGILRRLGSLPWLKRRRSGEGDAEATDPGVLSSSKTSEKGGE